MNDTGQTSGAFDAPNDFNVVNLGTNPETTAAPSPNQLQQPSYAGLAGTPAQPTFDASAMHTQQQPEEAKPDPAAQAARGAFAALSGAGGHPMDWARATLAGGLAAAANVGQAPKGGGFLYGVSRGAGGAEQVARQQQQDAQAKQQQQFAQQEKLKQDAVQQKQLDNELQNSTAQRALTTAQTASSIQTAQQNAARFPTLQKEDQARYQQLSDQIHKSEADTLSVLSAAGVDVSKLEHITSQDQLTDSHAKQAGSGSVFAVPNGEAHAEGDDKAGAYVVPGDVWDKKTGKDVTITTGWDIDPKTGKATPKTTTAQAGTSVGTLIAIAQGAQGDLAKKQQAIISQASAQEATVKAANAQTDESLAQGQKRAETAELYAKAAAEKEKGAGAAQKPVYAYNTQTKEMEQTTRADMEAHPNVYTNPVDVKQADIEKDKEAASQLGDAQMNLSRAKAASDAYDSLSLGDKRAVSAILGDDKFKAQIGLFGTHAELPADWLNKMLNSENYQQLSPQARSAVVSYLGLKSGVIAYQKALTKSGRSSDKQLQIEESMLPDPTLPKASRDAMLERFQQNVDQVSKNMPKMVGIERPQELRQRLEAEEAQKRGATHVYNPASGGAEPVKNIFGKVIGHKGPNGEVVRDQ